MTKHVQEWTVENRAWPQAKPLLSVLIPFLNDDPRPLLAALDREAKELGRTIEIVLLDDGTGDDEMAHLVISAVQAARLPARSIRLLANEGRSKGRNRLARHARAKHLLFLDSDMLPDAANFLARYLELIESEDPAVAFGGFSLHQAPHDQDHALHRRMALRSDCARADVRRRHPEKFVFTSNLLIRRDVFESEAFDESFTGWGWEDVEWGVRVSRSHKIFHIDNPATHLGLDSARVLASKYEQAGSNFALILKAQPDVVRRYPTYQVARAMKYTPMRKLWGPALKAMALAAPMPLPLRALSLRLYRVSVCAAAV